MCSCVGGVREHDDGSAPTGASADLPIEADEAVLHGEQGGAGSGRHPDLGVDVLGVMLSGAPRDEQPLGNLGVGAALGDQSQHLGLAFGQSGRQRAAAHRSLLASLGEHRRGGIVVEAPGLRLVDEHRGRLVVIEGGAVRAGADHRGEGIRRGQDAHRHRDRRARRAPVVPRPVETLVVHPRHRRDRIE